MLGDVESEDVLAKIQQTAVALNWSLEVLDMPTEKNVKDRLFSGTTPDIVHFMGHGRFDTEDGEASLALVNPTGGTDWVPDRSGPDHDAGRSCAECGRPACMRRRCARFSPQLPGLRPNWPETACRMLLRCSTK